MIRITKKQYQCKVVVVVMTLSFLFLSCQFCTDAFLSNGGRRFAIHSNNKSSCYTNPARPVHDDVPSQQTGGAFISSACCSAVIDKSMGASNTNGIPRKRQVSILKSTQSFNVEVNLNNRAVATTTTTTQKHAAVYIGNIDWKKSKEEIIDIVLTRIQCYCENIVLSRENIFIKPKTNKKRDENKLHGGSLIITLNTSKDAELVMKSLSNDTVKNDLTLLLNPKIIDSGGSVKIRWSIDPTEMKNSINGTSNKQMMKKVQQLHQEEHSLSEEDQKLMEHRKNRALKYQRQRRRIAQRTDSILDHIRPQFIPSASIDILHMVVSSDSDDSTKKEYIDWSTVPEEIDPTRGGELRVNTNRGFRKQAQVEAFVYVLQHALLSVSDDAINHPRTTDDGCIKIADLGCGGGNLSLPLAWFLSHKSHASTSTTMNDIQVVAVDINKHALKRLDKRAKDIGLDVETVQEDLLNLIASSKTSLSAKVQGKSTTGVLDSCSAVVSLHACGAASDLAIHSAVSHSLPFAISPCCIGKVKSIRDVSRLPSMASQRAGTPSDGTISYPRSTALSSILGTYESNDGGLIDEYSLLLSAADYSMSDGFVYNADRTVRTDDAASNSEYISKMSEQDQAFHRRGKMAKLIVETDRLKWAEEQGYYTRMMELPKLGATYPKREILLGAMKGTLAAKRIARLPARSTQLWAKLSDNDDEGDSNDDKVNDMNDVGNDDVDRMDLGGFANYLAPYALALIGSIAITAAFFKFVLLDY